FEGWEADDVIATLATRADEAGIRTTVVSTDRDAFQLVTDNVALMMTPRGVSDVQVYTPDRVEARYGIKPEQIPDFIGLKGDSSDNIPGIPGIGDKTAGQLIAQYGSVDEVIAHADELSPARKKNVLEFAEQARLSKQLATMRRDLDIDCDPSELVLSPPDRSQLREMFRRFEFRNLFNRIDELDEAVPAAQRIIAGTPVRWAEAPELPRLSGDVSVAVRDQRVAVARDGEPVAGAPVRTRERGAIRPDRAPADRRARGDGGCRRQDRHVPDGRDHGAAGRPRRGARVAGVRARGRGVHARLDAAARARALREARA